MDIEITAREESDDEPGPAPPKKRRRRRKPSKPASAERPAWSRLEDLLEQRRLKRELADFEDDSDE